MTDREKIIKIIEKNGTYNGRSFSFDYYVIQPDDIADALIAAGIGDVTEWKEKVECAKRILQIPSLPDGKTNMAYFEYNGERIQDIARQRDEWKERAERMHKEALKQKQLVSDAKHSEDALRNQIECAMDMVSEMEHAKRTLKILYMSGVIAEEALGEAVKQAKREIEEENDDDR